ncbi:MAG: acylase [Proteobacteria bacterium]|nr:acylase [Pseudomonadota bacterium]MDA0993086.1 acylase [Pseudomonadota bacterium]
MSLSHSIFIRAIAIFLLFLSACSEQPAGTTGAADAEIARLEARAANVTIIRDDFGVPHIYGKTDADAVFGMLYAQSEDDFNRVERNYIWATGRLAEVEGEEALYSDLRARLYMTIEEAQAAYDASPDWLKALCDAYADGINYYLYSHPDVKPRLLTRFEPWMPMFFSEGSIGGDIESVDLDGIKALYGGMSPLETLRSNVVEDRELVEPKGSNGFAISGEHTKSGAAMLLINPHTSFFFRGEIHVVSEEGLNAYGAVTWGQFFVYQGFNENTGWMHTSTGVDFMDDFVEDVYEEGDGLFYRYGDESRPVTESLVTLKYVEGDRMLERTFPTYRTHHGPITHIEDGKWTATKLNWDPVNALQQSFIRTKLKNHEEFWKMMDIRTNSSNNTVFADSSGNIAYYHGNFIPRRDPTFDFSQPVDGSDPATDWQGLHDVEDIVTVVNPANGWIQNTNSTPFTSAAESSPKRADFPVYMAPDDENFRGIHAVRVLTGVSDLTLDGLLDIAYDTYLPGFQKLIPGLVEAYDQSDADNSAIAGAIAYLRDWDLRVSEDSIAMTLAHFYGSTYNEIGDRPDAIKDASFMERVDHFGTGSPPEERLAIFAATVAMLEADFGQWDTPWGEVNRYQRLNGDIQQAFNDGEPSLPIGMASGNWGALASFGARRYPGTRRIYGTSGNSFVAVVEFGDRVRAKSMLAGGQSGDPSSPHFDDQAQRYVDRDFKDVAYYKEDVEARATRTYHPGE